MLLVITNSEDSTADYLCRKLDRSTIRYLRINTDVAVARLKIGSEGTDMVLSLGSYSVLAASVRDVWYRRPKPLLPTDQADQPEAHHTSLEFSEAIENFLALVPTEKWMNHPAQNYLASHKFEQLRRAAGLGLAIPDTLITQNPGAARAFMRKMGDRVVVKPLASGYIERGGPPDDTLIYTSEVTAEDMSQVSLVTDCPTCFQERVDKTLDVRVSVVDGDLTAVGMSCSDEAGTGGIDIRRDNMANVCYCDIDVPTQVADAVLRFVRSYGLRFSAIDMVVDKHGRWYFLENNPNGQWAWLDLVGGQDLASLFIRAFGK